MAGTVPPPFGQPRNRPNPLETLLPNLFQALFQELNDRTEVERELAELVRRANSAMERELVTSIESFLLLMEHQPGFLPARLQAIAVRNPGILAGLSVEIGRLLNDHVNILASAATQVNHPTARAANTRPAAAQPPPATPPPPTPVASARYTIDNTGKLVPPTNPQVPQPIYQQNLLDPSLSGQDLVNKLQDIPNKLPAPRINIAHLLNGLRQDVALLHNDPILASPIEIINELNKIDKQAIVELTAFIYHSRIDNSDPNAMSLNSIDEAVHLFGQSPAIAAAAPLGRLRQLFIWEGVTEDQLEALFRAIRRHLGAQLNLPRLQIDPKFLVHDNPKEVQANNLNKTIVPRILGELDPNSPIRQEIALLAQRLDNLYGTTLVDNDPTTPAKLTEAQEREISNDLTYLLLAFNDGLQKELYIDVKEYLLLELGKRSDKLRNLLSGLNQNDQDQLIEAIQILYISYFNTTSKYKSTYLNATLVGVTALAGGITAWAMYRLHDGGNRFTSGTTGQTNAPGWMGRIKKWAPTLANMANTIMSSGTGRNTTTAPAQPNTTANPASPFTTGGATTTNNPQINQTTVNNGQGATGGATPTPPQTRPIIPQGQPTTPAARTAANNPSTRPFPAQGSTSQGGTGRAANTNNPQINQTTVNNGQGASGTTTPTTGAPSNGQPTVRPATGSTARPTNTQSTVVTSSTVSSAAGPTGNPASPPPDPSGPPTIPPQPIAIDIDTTVSANTQSADAAAKTTPLDRTLKVETELDQLLALQKDEPELYEFMLAVVSQFTGDQLDAEYVVSMIHHQLIDDWYYDDQLPTGVTYEKLKQHEKLFAVLARIFRRRQDQEKYEQVLKNDSVVETDIEREWSTIIDYSKYKEKGTSLEELLLEYVPIAPYLASTESRPENISILTKLAKNFQYLKVHGFANHEEFVDAYASADPKNLAKLEKFGKPPFIELKQLLSDLEWLLHLPYQDSQYSSDEMTTKITELETLFGIAHLTDKTELKQIKDTVLQTNIDNILFHSRDIPFADILRKLRNKGLHHTYPFLVVLERLRQKHQNKPTEEAIPLTIAEIKNLRANNNEVEKYFSVLLNNLYKFPRKRPEEVWVLLLRDLPNILQLLSKYSLIAREHKPDDHSVADTGDSVDEDQLTNELHRFIHITPNIFEDGSTGFNDYLNKLEDELLNNSSADKFRIELAKMKRQEQVSLLKRVIRKELRNRRGPLYQAVIRNDSNLETMLEEFWVEFISELDETLDPIDFVASIFEQYSHEVPLLSKRFPLLNNDGKSQFAKLIRAYIYLSARGYVDAAEFTNSYATGENLELMKLLDDEPFHEITRLLTNLTAIKEIKLRLRQLPAEEFMKQFSDLVANLNLDIPEVDLNELYPLMINQYVFNREDYLEETLERIELLDRLNINSQNLRDLNLLVVLSALRLAKQKENPEIPEEELAELIATEFMNNQAKEIVDLRRRCLVLLGIRGADTAHTRVHNSIKLVAEFLYGIEYAIKPPTNPASTDNDYGKHLERNDDPEGSAAIDLLLGNIDLDQLTISDAYLQYELESNPYQIAGITEFVNDGLTSKDLILAYNELISAQVTGYSIKRNPVSFIRRLLEIDPDKLFISGQTKFALPELLLILQLINRAKLGTDFASAHAELQTNDNLQHYLSLFGLLETDIEELLLEYLENTDHEESKDDLVKIMQSSSDKVSTLKEILSLGILVNFFYQNNLSNDAIVQYLSQTPSLYSQPENIDAIIGLALHIADYFENYEIYRDTAREAIENSIINTDLIQAFTNMEGELEIFLIQILAAGKNILLRYPAIRNSLEAEIAEKDVEDTLTSPDSSLMKRLTALGITSAGRLIIDTWINLTAGTFLASPTPSDRSHSEPADRHEEPVDTIDLLSGNIDLGTLEISESYLQDELENNPYNIQAIQSLFKEDFQANILIAIYNELLAIEVSGETISSQSLYEHVDTILRAYPDLGFINNSIVLTADDLRTLVKLVNRAKVKFNLNNMLNDLIDTGVNEYLAQFSLQEDLIFNLVKQNLANTGDADLINKLNKIESLENSQAIIREIISLALLRNYFSVNSFLLDLIEADIPLQEIELKSSAGQDRLAINRLATQINIFLLHYKGTHNNAPEDEIPKNQKEELKQPDLPSEKLQIMQLIPALGDILNTEISNRDNIFVVIQKNLRNYTFATRLKREGFTNDSIASVVLYMIENPGYNSVDEVLKKVFTLKIPNKEDQTVRFSEKEVEEILELITEVRTIDKADSLNAALRQEGINHYFQSLGYSDIYAGIFEFQSSSEEVGILFGQLTLMEQGTTPVESFERLSRLALLRNILLENKLMNEAEADQYLRQAVVNTVMVSNASVQILAELSKLLAEWLLEKEGLRPATPIPDVDNTKPKNPERLPDLPKPDDEELHQATNIYADIYTELDNPLKLSTIDQLKKEIKDQRTFRKLIKSLDQQVRQIMLTKGIKSFEISKILPLIFNAKKTWQFIDLPNVLNLNENQVAIVLRMLKRSYTRDIDPRYEIKNEQFTMDSLIRSSSPEVQQAAMSLFTQTETMAILELERVLRQNFFTYFQNIEDERFDSQESFEVAIKNIPIKVLKSGSTSDSNYIKLLQDLFEAIANELRSSK